MVSEDPMEQASLIFVRDSLYVANNVTLVLQCESWAANSHEPPFQKFCALDIYHSRSEEHTSELQSPA